MLLGPFRVSPDQFNRFQFSDLEMREWLNCEIKATELEPLPPGLLRKPF